MKRSLIFANISKELDSANSKYRGFYSTHEGVSVIRKELDALWDLTKISKKMKGNRLMYNESIQIAAMAIKFIETLCLGEVGDGS